jgi:hypothetical protein
VFTEPTPTWFASGYSYANAFTGCLHVGEGAGRTCMDDSYANAFTGCLHVGEGAGRTCMDDLVVKPRRLPHPLAIEKAFVHLGSSAAPTI